MAFTPAFLAGLHQSRHAQLSSIPPSAQAWVLAQLWQSTGQSVVHVLPHDKEMAAMAALCRFLLPEAEILTLPAWDTLPYDRVSPSAAITATRLSTLGRLATRENAAPYILLTTANAATQKLPPREMFQTARFEIYKGRKLNRAALFEFLSNNGYTRVGKVMEAGEFAVRGSLIDLFPAGAEEGIRIDLFDDEVESLKRFDPLTQLSDMVVDSLALRPVSEVLLQPSSIAFFRTRYLELFGAVTHDDPLYASISEGRTYAGMEHWLPLFYERLDTLADYTPGAMFSMDARCDDMMFERDKAVADYYDARKMHQQKNAANYNPVPPEQLFLNHEKFRNLWRNRTTLRMTQFATDGATDLGIRPSPQLHSLRHAEGAHARDMILQFLNEAKTPVTLAANSTGSADRIQKMLNLNDNSEHKIVILPIENGFIAPDRAIITEQDMFGERIIRTQKKKRKSETFLQEAASFAMGELIVHREHGIGRFEGLVTVEVNDSKHDCLKLIYDGDAKLFLPVENIDLVSRYGTSDGPVPLDKLGGVAWQKRKSALKKRLKLPPKH